MDKGKVIRITAWTVVGLIAAFGTYKLVKYFVDKNKEEDKTDEEEKTVTESASSSGFNANKPVKFGSSGSEVGAIQTAFNNIIADMAKLKDYKQYCDIQDPKGDILKCIEESKTWYQPYATTEDIINCQTKHYQSSSTASAEACIQKKKRRDQIAKLNKIMVTGKFDQPTLDLARVIMGKTQFSYGDVKQKRIDFSSAYKYKNPYSK